MIAYVMVIIIVGGFGASLPAITTAEFYNEASCNKAMLRVESVIKPGSGMVLCLPKRAK